MVKVNLSKLIQLVNAIRLCPLQIPYRNEKLYDDYLLMKSSSDDVVSLSITASLERIRETHLDEEDSERKRLIVFHLIDTYSKSSISVRHSQINYLITGVKCCPICEDENLIIIKPSRCHNAVLFTRSGSKKIKVFHKQCSNLDCMATIYYCYAEYRSDSILQRRYYQNSELDIFSITQDTFFETAFLNEVSEDVFTCYSRFVHIACKYNRLFSGYQLNHRRLLHCWLLYMIYQKLGHIQFPVERDNHRALDVEHICEILYPSLKEKIDQKWKFHICNGCKNRTVIMDGAAKVYRTCCAASPKKIVNFGSLNKFIACSNSPIKDSKYCKNHLNGQIGEIPERLDYAYMTRSKTRELGLDKEFLTTSMGCRKREAINVRQTRKKTAGMVYCYRACGISIGHCEAIHAETCTIFMVLLVDLFGCSPSSDLLTGCMCLNVILLYNSYC